LAELLEGQHPKGVIAAVVAFSPTCELIGLEASFTFITAYLEDT